MPNQELLQYIKTQREVKISDDLIISTLLKSNWSQNDIELAMNPTPPTPPTQNSVPVPTPIQSSLSIPSFNMLKIDANLSNIITKCVIFSVIGTAISDGGKFLAQFVVGGYAGQVRYAINTMYGGRGYSQFWLINPQNLITNLITSTVVGVVLGFVIANWWGPIRAYVSQYSGGFLNSPFKILFYPTLAWAVFGLLGSFAFGLMATVIMIGSAIAGRYVFAKGISGLIEKNFPVERC